MARADAISLGGPGGAEDGYARWIAGGALALGLHAAAILYLTQAPPPHQFNSDAPIELDLAPPPSQEQQEAAPEQAEAAPPEQAETDDAPPEELAEITDEEIPPPPDETPTVVEDTPEDVTTVEEPIEMAEVPQELETVETPPDVEAAVSLPPEQTVKAIDVTPEPKPEPKPVVKRDPPKPVVRREEPKPVVRREQPKPAPKREEQRPVAQARVASRPSAPAGGTTSAGRAGDPNATRAAASAYGGRVRSAVNATKSCVAGVNGRAVVRFTVNRAGNVTSASASGESSVAAAAVAIVRRAGIPPMPPEMAKSSANYALAISLSKC